jgi:2-polyprenyl-3-methyl-5-hydroxy-6-metoxy-1,4-benzoquinol methylase
MRCVMDRLVRPAAGSALLDFGCGNGRLVPFAKDCQYVGVDSNPGYIASAREQHGSATASFVCADVDDLAGLGVGPFDSVVSIGVIHHLDDSVAKHALGSAAKMLKPNGRLITMDPCFEPNQRPIARVLMALDRGKYVRHPEGYTAILGAVAEVQKSFIWSDVYRFPYSHFVTVSSPLSASAASTLQPFDTHR